MREYDAIVVGAGFAGLYALYRLREAGLSVRVFEQGDGVGGTWYWNRYPGARCDVESMEYSYSFSEELEQEWEWTERYPTQPEILRYLNNVADRFDLRPDIQLRTRVVAVHYDEDAGHWTVKTDDGAMVRADFCVMASGCLSAVNRPAFPGLDDFRGDWYHTARWPGDGVDLTGKRVGFVGTGSTGIQAIPQIAKQAKHLYVFQRTANFSIPARNAPLDSAAQRAIKANYREIRRLQRESGGGASFTHPDVAQPVSAFDVSPEERDRILESGWTAGGAAGVLFAFNDLLIDPAANEAAADFVRAKIRSIVADRATAEALCPHTHPIGTKRICVDIDYYETYNRENVTLVDVRGVPIEGITATGVQTVAGHYEVDALVFAIGFDAMTGALTEIDLRGRGGQVLKDKWASGPRAYLGLATAGFPNLFIVTGPGSPSVLSNMVVSIEQHVDWIADCITDLRDRGQSTIEATHEAEDAWVAHVNQLADATLYPRANSWYVGANIPGKARVFMPYVGGVGNYRIKCDEVRSNGYEGFLCSALARSMLRA
jgi:cyclohexanone monooxygenase